MRSRTLILTGAICLFAAAMAQAALTNEEFDSGGTGWTTYATGSGSVTFPGTTAQINAFVTSLAGLEQTDSSFSTTGQERLLTIQINDNGNILAGWRNSSDVDGTTVIYSSGATGVRTVGSDDPAFNKVFAEKIGVGGIINVEYMRVTDVTGPPTFAGIATAARTSLTGADLTWAAGTDSVTPQGQIIYRIYWSTNSANVITDGVKTSSTAGATTIGVTGLPSGQQVFFTVRAEDRVAHRDTNTVQQSIASLTAVENWFLYE